MGTAATSGLEGLLVREGEYWNVAAGSGLFRLKDSKGLRYLSVLLAHPGVEINAQDLAREEPERRRPRIAEGDLPVADLGDAGAALDTEAKAAYRARIEDLRCELEEAEAFNDPERADRARDEIEFLARELSAAVGLGGRDRRAASSAERARLSVTRALRAAIDRIESNDETLGRYLQGAIRTGAFCSYTPVPRVEAMLTAAARPRHDGAPEPLPTGTVTLLFSDIEGSTRLLSELGPRYGELLEVHRELLRTTWRAHRGVEVSTEGDGFFVAFSEPQDAVAAAVAAQRALRAHGGLPRVRMGVHTGSPQVHSGERDYWGEDVHFAARVAAAAHGGQILISPATAERARGELEDLGTWRLKDFGDPTRLFQAVVDGEGADRFPAPRALDVRPSNLPVPETKLIGRAGELRTVARMLTEPSTRLLTLVGLGGSGKTRLALAIGHELLEHFRDGVFFADLSGATEATAIPRIVADAVGAPEPTAEGVRDRLSGRDVLVIVDNCEHVLDGVGVLAGWLAAGERLRVLATSQAPLRLRAERCIHLESLSMPDAQRLFVERAQALDSRFELTEDNAAAVAEICRRLEGSPMAIELAAARLRVLGPQRLAERLRSGLDAISAVTRDMPARQSSLRAALEWSLSVLDEDARTVFGRWGVFAGRPTLERVEAVCGEGVDALAATEVLVDHSFVRHEEDGRFRMPQSVQAHARERLDAGGELSALQRRHAEAMAATAEHQYARFLVDTAATIRDVTADREDLLAALEWAERHDPALHARLAGAMILPRVGLGGVQLQRDDVETALARTPDPTPTRVRLLTSRAVIAYGLGDREVELTAFEAALAAAREVCEPREQVLLMAAFAKAVTSGDQPSVDARALVADARALARAAGENDLLPLLDGLLGEACLVDGDLEEAAQLLRFSTDGGARHLVAIGAESYEADLALHAGDVARALDGYAGVARRAALEGLEADAGWQIVDIGACLIALGHPVDGLALIGAGRAFGERVGSHARPAYSQAWVERNLARARTQLDDDEVRAHLERGRSMDRDVALGLALRAPTIARTGIRSRLGG